ncbi:hypothetical protein BD414DRAFT_501243 [Trametes punicea]|nr:hypothetical protein BD414DRAFT_501243 [Trametes punicea]
MPERCANCRGQTDLVIAGFVQLDYAMAKHCGPDSLGPAIVRPYLTRNLHWRVKKASVPLSIHEAMIYPDATYVDGTVVVSVESVVSLEIVLLATPFPFHLESTSQRDGPLP